MTEDLARVRRIVLSLPNVDEGTTFGYPAFKVGGKPLAWFPKKQEVEPGTLAVRVSFVERDHRIARHSEIYYYTPHYKDYPSVLVRVWLLKDGELRELLASAHEFMAAGSTRRKKRSG